jgi:hypothetical protein
VKTYGRTKAVMITEQWQLGLLMGALVLHLLAIGLAYRQRGGSLEPSTGTPGRSVVDRDVEVIECPECDTENDLGYRYCRSCVSELPGPTPSDRAGNTPLGRFAR